MPRVDEGSAGEVTIVSTNPETLDSLRTYLSGAGVQARCTHDLRECASRMTPATLAFVLFPDDFRWEIVVTTLADLAAQRPDALPVLVTAHPQRFERLTSAENVLIVPRPVWGWTILDAIRAHIERQGSRRREAARAP
jgi:DNA-binding response OmpR family regulator